MSDFVVVLSAAAPSEAMSIARTLVKERLAACVNIVPVKSCYRWEGEIHEDPEDLLIIKTRSAILEDIKRRIKELHSYAVPEIIAIPLTDGYEPYLAWIRETTG